MTYSPALALKRETERLGVKARAQESHCETLRLELAAAAGARDRAQSDVWRLRESRDTWKAHAEQGWATVERLRSELAKAESECATARRVAVELAERIVVPFVLSAGERIAIRRWRAMLQLSGRGPT